MEANYSKGKVSSCQFPEKLKPSIWSRKQSIASCCECCENSNKQDGNKVGPQNADVIRFIVVSSAFCVRVVLQYHDEGKCNKSDFSDRK